MGHFVPKCLVLALLALGASGQESSPSLEELVRDLHLRLNLMSLEFHEQMEQLVTEQQLLRQSVEKLSWAVDRVDQSMKNIEHNHDVVMRNLSHVTSQSDTIMVNQQFCANHDRLRDLYFETLPRCQGPPLPPVTTEPPQTTTYYPAVFASCSTAPPVSGLYNIVLNSGDVVQLFCEQNLQGGGWAVFQRRMDGSVDFNRTFAEYLYGFGDPRGEFWMGLETLHALTNSVTQLLIDMEDFNNVQQYAHYSTFAVDSAENNFRFHMSTGSYSGSAGDSFSDYNMEKFATHDTGSSFLHCADLLASGFWHYDCGLSLRRNNLNGIYGFDKEQKGIWWGTFGGATTQNRAPLKRVQMMVKF